MEKCGITLSQLRKLVEFHKARNAREFQLLCDKYDINSRTMWVLLKDMRIAHGYMFKYGITMDELFSIDERFLGWEEASRMMSDPTIKHLTDIHGIEFYPLHTLYENWYCFVIAPKWSCVSWDGYLYDDLHNLIGADKMKELFKFYL